MYLSLPDPACKKEKRAAAWSPSHVPKGKFYAKELCYEKETAFDRPADPDPLPGR
jgi:hypothetical protein